MRGLKLFRVKVLAVLFRSHPAWGAWIETDLGLYFNSQVSSHPAWGAWIETAAPPTYTDATQCRTPPGVRGLKQNY